MKLGQNSNHLQNTFELVRKVMFGISQNGNVLGDSSLSPSQWKMVHELPMRFCNDLCKSLIVISYRFSPFLIHFFFYLNKLWKPRIQEQFICTSFGFSKIKITQILIGCYCDIYFDFPLLNDYKYYYQVYIAPKFKHIVMILEGSLTLQHLSSRLDLIFSPFINRQDTSGKESA